MHTFFEIQTLGFIYYDDFRATLTKYKYQDSIH